MPDLYTLIGRLPVPCDDMHTWGRWMRDARDSRIVARNDIGPLYISTVFLGMDHSFCGGHPMLFECMIFDGIEDSYQTRSETWAEAEAMHKHAVEIATGMVERAEFSMRQFIKRFEEPKP